MRGVLADALLALFTSIVVSLCVAAWCVYMTIDARLVDMDTWISQGRDPWMVSRHGALGVGWVNATKMDSPLLSTIDESGAPPGWAVRAMSPMDQFPHGARVAALGAGWPMIQIVRVWSTARNDELFPPSSEFDVSGSCLEMGKDRLLEEPIRFVVVPIAFGVDALPWMALSYAALRLHRRRSALQSQRSNSVKKMEKSEPPASTTR